MKCCFINRILHLTSKFDASSSNDESVKYPVSDAVSLSAVIERLSRQPL